MSSSENLNNTSFPFFFFCYTWDGLACYYGDNLSHLVTMASRHASQG